MTFDTHGAMLLGGVTLLTLARLGLPLVGLALLCKFFEWCSPETTSAHDN